MSDEGQHCNEKLENFGPGISFFDFVVTSEGFHDYAVKLISLPHHRVISMPF